MNYCVIISRTSDCSGFKNCNRTRSLGYLVYVLSLGFVTGAHWDRVSHIVSPEQRRRTDSSVRDSPHCDILGILVFLNSVVLAYQHSTCSGIGSNEIT